MQRIIFTLSLLFGCLITNAQWNGNPAENNRITPLGTEIYDFEFGTSSDGTSFITFNRPMGNVATFLQIVDVNGNMLFSEDGMLVSNHPTLSWTQTNQLLLVDDDGNAIISVSDCRNSTGEDLSFTLYKVSPTGEMLWGENGIDLCGGIAFELIASMNIIQLEDGNYVCAWSVYQGDDGYIQLQKISKTGNLLWGDAVKIIEPSAVIDYPYLVNAGNNQVIVVFSRVTGSFVNKNLRARKIDSDGANVWAADLSVFSGYFGYVPLWVNLRVISDNMGGAFMGWYDTRDNPNKESTYVAHVKNDGTLGFNGAEGGVKIGHGMLRGFFPEMYCDNDEGFVYVAWRETDDMQNWQQLSAQKIAIASGELLWTQNGITISPLTYHHSISFYTIQDGGNGNAAVFFTSCTYHPQYYYGWDINNVILLNSAGDYVWEDEIIQFSNPVSLKGNMLSSSLQFNGYWLTLWGDERVVPDDPAGTKKLYMQRVNINGTLGEGGDICFPPTNVVIDEVTHNSVVVSWEGETDDYEVSYRIVNEEWNFENVLGAHSFLLENLIPLTDYQVRVRSICTEEVSIWSVIKSFTTLDTQQPCEVPVNLVASEITEHSAKLSWQEGNDQNLSWDLRYCEASATSWITVEALNEKSFILEELIPNTAYLWTVRAHCAEEQTSEWATESNFTTLPLGIEGILKEAVTVYASGKVLNIINPDNRFIEKVQLFSIDGKLLGDYAVNATDNVLIPTTLNEMILFVKIMGKEEFTTHKVLMK